MVFFIYKCYYVFFLHFSKRKDLVPWNSSVTILATACALYLLTSMELSGILDTITPDPLTNSESTRKGKILLFIIPFCVLVWYAIDYVLFNLAKASKTDGSSERYSFSPTKRDKTVCWLACFLSISLVFIVVGIKVLFGLK